MNPYCIAILVTLISHEGSSTKLALSPLPQEPSSITTLVDQTTVGQSGGRHFAPAISPLVKLKPLTSQRIKVLEMAVRQEQGMADSAAELIQVAAELFDRKNPSSASSVEASRISRNLFLSSAPPAIRGKAFGMYRAGYPREYLNHVQEVQLIVPGVTCFGRLQDSFQQHLVQPNDWIWSVRVENSHRNDLTMLNRKAEDLVLGNDAIVTITMNRSSSTSELKKALVDSKAYQMQKWQIMLPQRLLDLN